MQVTKGTISKCILREQCVPGSLSSSPAQEPGNEAMYIHVRVNPVMYAGYFNRILNWISEFQSGFPDSGWISGFQIGFLDFRLDFWISDWISEFQFGFLDFRVDFWTSVWIYTGFQLDFC